MQSGVLHGQRSGPGVYDGAFDLVACAVKPTLVSSTLAEVHMPAACTHDTWFLYCPGGLVAPLYMHSSLQPARGAEAEQQPHAVWQARMARLFKREVGPWRTGQWHGVVHTNSTLGYCLSRHR